VVDRAGGVNFRAGAKGALKEGVSRYKRTSDPSALADTARAFQKAYTDTPWAKKASVWAG
jgi:hypothetical protein